jgi:hypothetical protein
MGLGSMTEDFCRAMKPERVIIIDRQNGQTVDPQGMGLTNYQVVTQTQWNGASKFQLAEYIGGTGMTVVGFEIFYRDDFCQVMKGLGVRTVLFPMWEWTPCSDLSADVLVNLSDTDQNYPGQIDPSYPGQKQGVRYDWPASPAVRDPHRVIHWPPRTFVHFAGNASNNRDGTRQVLEAATYLRDTDAKLVVYASFSLTSDFSYDVSSPIEVRPAVTNRIDLLRGADCVVCPRRLPGHSLPISEATGEGIPVIVQDLPDWRSYPYRVPSCQIVQERIGQGYNTVWTASSEALGKLMRDMTTGKINREPCPKVPAWGEFKLWWDQNVMKKGATCGSLPTA